jgi:hypothetical protein
VTLRGNTDAGSRPFSGSGPDGVQIARRGVRDRHVLDPMRRVPREAFVEPGFEEFAYEDGSLPIGEDYTISQPYIVALMIEAAELRPGDKVLEVGTGFGLCRRHREPACPRGPYHRASRQPRRHGPATVGQRRL